ncbi:MAG: GNAT family N-acetyltransferase [Phycisphaerales bacterium]|nr:GNAT family N-acetyltransferase [Phycisphaerales bacterium]
MSTWVSPITLRGRVVTLEPLDERHAPGLLTAADPELVRFTPQAPKEWSVEGFAADVRRVNALPDVVAFAIILNATGAVIGRTTYMDIQPAHRGLEIGRTWISRPYHGTAVNPDAKYLMLEHAFETLGAIRVQLTTGASNLHSQAAIAKLGAVREGVLRSNRIMPDGNPRDTVYFSILAAEWPAVKAKLEERRGGT